MDPTPLQEEIHTLFIVQHHRQVQDGIESYVVHSYRVCEDGDDALYGTFPTKVTTDGRLGSLEAFRRLLEHDVEEAHKLVYDVRPFLDRLAGPKFQDYAVHASTGRMYNDGRGKDGELFFQHGSPLG